MKYSFKKLQDRIDERFGSMTEFSKAMGVPEKRLTKEMQSDAGWTVEDIGKAVKLLEIPSSEVEEYFFSEEKEEPDQPVKTKPAQPKKAKSPKTLSFDDVEQLSDDLRVLEFVQRTIELECGNLYGYAERLTEKQRNEFDNLYSIVGVYHERMRKILDSFFN